MTGEEKPSLEEQVRLLTGRVLKLETDLKKEETPKIDYNKEFEEYVELVDIRSLQEIFRETDDYHISCACVGLKPELMQRVKASVSKNRWQEMMKEYEESLSPKTKYGKDESSIRFGREEIVSKIIKLEQMGMIIVAGRADERDSFSTIPCRDGFSYEDHIKEQQERVNKFKENILRPWYEQIKNISPAVDKDDGIQV